MKVQKKERTDNPLTDHTDEPDSVDIVTKTDKPDEDPKEVVLSTEPPERDDDETTEPDGSVWRAKKRARKQQYDEMQTQLEQERTARQEAEARANALWAAQQVQQQPQQKPADPFEEEEKKLKEEWDKHIERGNLLQKSATQEQARQWQDDHYALQRRGQQLSAKRELAAAGLTPGQRVNMGEESLKAQLASDYADVVGNMRHLTYADGLARQRSAQLGRGLSRSELDDVMNETRRVFRLPTARSTAPSQDVRQKFSGTGLGGASGASNGSGAGQIRMNEDMMAMAEAKYTRERDPKTGQWRKLSKAEAHAKWAQNEGKRVAERYR